MARADANSDLNEMARRYVPAAREAGDEVLELDGEDGHFTLIDPAAQVWADTRSLVRNLLSR